MTTFDEIEIGSIIKNKLSKMKWFVMGKSTKRRRLYLRSFVGDPKIITFDVFNKLYVLVK